MHIFFLTLGILLPIIFAIRPFRIGGHQYSFATGSLISLVALALVGVIDLSSVVGGIIGSSALEPWKIIVIFFSVAYVSISADATGIFDYFARQIAHRASGSRFRLFVSFYIFAGLLTVLTSNDIVILTLTPVIFYLSKYIKIDILPFLFAEFFVANTASMYLMVDDPTSIILASSTGISFAQFAQNMWVPATVGVVLNFLLLSLLFKKRLKGTFTLKKNLKLSLRNAYDAWSSFGLVLLMLVTLSVSHLMGIQIWEVTAVFAVAAVLKDLYFAAIDHTSAIENVVRRMPWRILPFVAVMFIFIHQLNQLGVVEYFVDWISGITDPVLQMIAMGGSTFLLTNLVNNQPASVFMATALSSDALQAAPGLTRQLLTYPAAIAAVLGANLTVLGALAGLMWRGILADQGVRVSYGDFLKIGLLVTPTVFSLTLASFIFFL